MTNNERISQLEEMMSDLLKRFDATIARIDILADKLDRSDAQQQAFFQQQQTLSQQQQALLQELRQSDERQQVMLRALVQQTDTNTAMMRKLENHENRLNSLEGGKVTE